MINIKEAVLRFKKSKPEIKDKEIAALLFPTKTDNRAKTIMSRWMNGHELDTIKANDLPHICKVLKTTPNKILKWNK